MYLHLFVYRFILITFFVIFSLSKNIKNVSFCVARVCVFSDDRRKRQERKKSSKLSKRKKDMQPLKYVVKMGLVASIILSPRRRVVCRHRHLLHALEIDFFLHKKKKNNTIMFREVACVSSVCRVPTTTKSELKVDDCATT